MSVSKIIFEHYATSADRHGLTVGKMNKRQRWIEQRILLYRRHVENAILIKRGKITLTEAHYVLLAAECTRQCIIARIILRDYWKSLQPLERMDVTAKVTNAVARGAQAVSRLKLDGGDLDLDSDLYGDEPPDDAAGDDVD